MNIINVGISHHKAPIELREKLCFNRDVLVNTLEQFHSEANLNEIVILSTCNRMEIYATTKSNFSESVVKIKQIISKKYFVSTDDLSNYLYIHHGPGVVKHLFRVVSSLDSMVIGESQILGQVKEAYEISKKNGYAGALFNELFQRSFFVAKKVKSQTRIHQGITSISSAAVHQAVEILNDLNDKKVLVIGAGDAGELTLKYLIKEGVSQVFIANRNYQKTKSISEKYNGIPITLEQVLPTLQDVDIVISSTSTPEIVLYKKDAEKYIQYRSGRPLVMVDIAMPRDIDPDLNQIENVILFNIDDLNKIIQQGLNRRQMELGKCELIIENELKEYLSWYIAQSVNPLIRELKEEFKEITDRELKKVFNKLPDLDKNERIILNKLVNRISAQILHKPIATLKKSTISGNGYYYAKSLVDLFELDINKIHLPPKGREDL